MTSPETERQERLQVTAYNGTTHRFFTHDEVKAAIAAAMMGAVKPLEWGDLDGNTSKARAFYETSYHIWFSKSRDRFEVSLSYPAYGTTYDGPQWHDNMEAAKAAAQADYQARILSALAVPTDATAALNTMLAEAEKRGAGSGSGRCGLRLRTCARCCW